MVTSVSNNSANILALFQTGKDTGTDANSETLAKIQELAKDAEQMKASTSPARVQGASVATDAWISASVSPARGPSEVEEVHANAQRAIEMYENPQASDRTADGVSESTFQDNFSIDIGSVDSLIGEISKYNVSLYSLSNFTERANYYVRSFDRANSYEIRSAPGLERGGAIVRKAMASMIEFLPNMLFLNRTIVKEAPIAIEKAIAESKSNFVVDGTLAEKDENGRYHLGAFTVSTSDGHMLYKSDGQGTVLANTAETRGTEVWQEIHKGNDWIWS